MHERFLELRQQQLEHVQSRIEQCEDAIAMKEGTVYIIYEESLDRAGMHTGMSGIYIVNEQVVQGMKKIEHAVEQDLRLESES